MKIKLIEGSIPFDLSDAVVEFRGNTPDGKKIISSDGVVITDSKGGLFDYHFPNNFYTTPGRFKSAYFSISRGEHIDTTQNISINIIDGVNFETEDSEDIIDELDRLIEEVTDKMNRETQAMIDEIQKEYDNLEALMQKQADENIAKIDREIKIAIDESKLRMRQLESEYRGVINNAQLTLNQLQAEVDKLKPHIDDTNKQLDELYEKLDKIKEDLDRTDLVTQGDLDDSTIGGLNLLMGTRYFDHPWRLIKVSPTLDTDGFSYVTLRNSFNQWIYQPYDNWVKGEIYILSFDARSNEDAVINPKIETLGSPTWIIPIVSREFKRYTIPFVVNFENNVGALQILSRQDYADVHIKRIKLERADVSGGWNYSGSEIVDIRHINDLQKQIDELNKIVTALGGS